MKNLEQISKTIFNVVLNGSHGGTVDIKTGQLVTFSSGYLVGLSGFKVPRPYFVNAKYPINILAEMILGLPIESNLIGFWVDSNIVYIDVVGHFYNKSEAIKTGLSLNQTSIWDCENNTEIYLKP